jgi:integrase
MPTAAQANQVKRRITVDPRAGSGSFGGGFWGPPPFTMEACSRPPATSGRSSTRNASSRSTSCHVRHMPGAKRRRPRVWGPGVALLASDWRPRHASVSDVASTTDEARDEIDRQAQLALFDDVSGVSAPTSQFAWDQRRIDTNGDRGPRAAEETDTVGPLPHGSADRAALHALEEALVAARGAGDRRSAVAVLAASLGELGARPSPAPAHGVPLRQAREEWLRRLEVQQKSQSTLVGYRVAIDDLLDWSEAIGRDAHEEAAIVDYLRSYQERANPKPATYHRRFVLLRKFLRYVSRRHGVTDPFLDLGPPPKPRQESDWLTPEEFRRLLDAAGQPQRNLPGLAERDQLVLLALVLTGLRRSELCALDWRDLELDGRKPSLLVRSGKGGKSRRQPIATSLARQLQRLANAQNPEPTDPSSVAFKADGCSRQSSLTSSAARRSARSSKSTSPRTRSATRLRRGSARSSATRGSSPSTSVTPTSLPSRATPTSTVRSCSRQRVDWRNSPLPRMVLLLHLTSCRRAVLNEMSSPRPETGKTFRRASRCGHPVGDVGRGAAAAADRSRCPQDSEVVAAAAAAQQARLTGCGRPRRPAEALSAIRIRARRRQTWRDLAIRRRPSLNAGKPWAGEALSAPLTPPRSRVDKACL